MFCVLFACACVTSHCCITTPPFPLLLVRTFLAPLCSSLICQRASTATAAIFDHTLYISGLDPRTALLRDTAGGGHDNGDFGGDDFNAHGNNNAYTRFLGSAGVVDDRLRWKCRAVTPIEGNCEGESGRGGGDKGRSGGRSGGIVRALNKLPRTMADLAEIAVVEGLDDEVRSRRGGAWTLGAGER